MIMIWVICTDTCMANIQRKNIIITESMCMNTIMADTIMHIIMTDMTTNKSITMTDMTTTMIISMTDTIIHITMTSMVTTMITIMTGMITTTTIMSIGA